MPPGDAVDAGPQLLAEILRSAIDDGVFPDLQRFRLSHESELAVLDDLARANLVLPENRRYMLSLEGLRRCPIELARRELDAVGIVLKVMIEHFQRAPEVLISVADIAERTKLDTNQVRRTVAILARRRPPLFRALSVDRLTGYTDQFLVLDKIELLPPELLLPQAPEVEVHETVTPAEEVEEVRAPVSIRRRIVSRLEINGYRCFKNFVADLRPLNVVIGVNGSGKSSLFDFLRFVGKVAQAPLPPEIDERSIGRTLFFGGRPEVFDFALTMDLGSGPLVRYEAEVVGPLGRPSVAREKLAQVLPPSELDGHGKGVPPPFVYLDFLNGKGTVRDPHMRAVVSPDWTLQRNEFAIRRAVDPTQETASQIQAILAGVRVYEGFDVSSQSPMRRPVMTEPNPILRPDGANLSAVLLSLIHEFPTEWAELEGHLHEVVPGFRALNAKPRGGPGTIIGTWREDGVDGELTVADLSDGVLKFLGWATLAVSVNVPPLLCIEEPEIGLHPRVLPVLASLLKKLSSKTQVLIATHSPYLMSHFALDEIAVLRKDKGRTELVRPNSNLALRTLIEEVGSDALSHWHMNGDLPLP